jgi:Ribosomal protein S17
MSESTETIERNSRKTREGLVVSDKMDKTVVVTVEDRVKHAPLRQGPCAAAPSCRPYDENNDAHVGDRVLVMETKPLSKTKRWRVVEILERAK